MYFHYQFAHTYYFVNVWTSFASAVVGGLNLNLNVYVWPSCSSTLILNHLMTHQNAEFSTTPEYYSLWCNEMMSNTEKDKIGTGTNKKLLGFIMLFSGKELKETWFLIRSGSKNVLVWDCILNLIYGWHAKYTRVLQWVPDSISWVRSITPRNSDMAYSRPSGLLISMILVATLSDSIPGIRFQETIDKYFDS